MFKTPSRLNEEALVKITGALNANLADGLDLHGQIKVAHWNIKGPQFPSLHPLFETFALASPTSTTRSPSGRSRWAARPTALRGTSRSDRGSPTIRRRRSGISTTSRCSRTASTPTSTASAPPATWPRSWLTPIPSIC